MDIDVREEEVLSSIDELAEERQTEMDESQKPREEFHHEVHAHEVLFFSWQLISDFIKSCRSGCLKVIGSVRSWNCRECVRRAAETILLLLNYLCLYGGCASAGGAGGAGTFISPFSVSRTRSRHGVFTPCFAQRVFSYSNRKVFRSPVPGSYSSEPVASASPIFHLRSPISGDL